MGNPSNKIYPPIILKVVHRVLIAMLFNIINGLCIIFSTAERADFYGLRNDTISRSRPLTVKRSQLALKAFSTVSNITTVKDQSKGPDVLRLPHLGFGRLVKQVSKIDVFIINQAEVSRLIIYSPSPLVWPSRKLNWFIFINS